jgi:hypothetical protein
MAVYDTYHFRKNITISSICAFNSELWLNAGDRASGHDGTGKRHRGPACHGRALM